MDQKNPAFEILRKTKKRFVSYFAWYISGAWGDGWPVEAEAPGGGGRDEWAGRGVAEV